MSAYDSLFREIQLPRMYRLRQDIDRKHIEDVPGALRAELVRSGVLARVRPGSTVAIPAGSREIANYAQILRTLCDVLKERGAKPFIFPAMGSHGGAIAENQTALIAHFGITEEAMGVPILSSMAADRIGETPGGVVVYFDRNALSADAIIPVGRVKVHTCFHGRIESGVMKMLAVGCGKQLGAAAMHARGFANMSQNVTEVARVVLEKLPIPFGIGVVENACHQTRGIYAIPSEQIEEREHEILKISYRVSPKIPFAKVDVLVVDEIGKNISGTGMDPNITGRSSPLGISAPYADRVAVLDLTDASDGSAYGVGNADVITRRLFSKIILENTYPNGITNRDVKPMMIPPVMETERDALLFAIATIQTERRIDDLRIVWLHNTLCMEEFYVSEALANQREMLGRVTIERDHPFTIQFDDEGRLMHP